MLAHSLEAAQLPHHDLLDRRSVVVGLPIRRDVHRQECLASRLDALRPILGQPEGPLAVVGLSDAGRPLARRERLRHLGGAQLRDPSQEPPAEVEHEVFLADAQSDRFAEGLRQGVLLVARARRRRVCAGEGALGRLKTDAVLEAHALEMASDLEDRAAHLQRPLQQCPAGDSVSRHVAAAIESIAVSTALLPHLLHHKAARRQTPR
mmetsp:Transcript_67179/g.194262  ORF Transcript_67179/g.194262 Transcript_67179/m.194262 type:complete len:207 (+) Transcript_67179:992-1612(+)